MLYLVFGMVHFGAPLSAWLAAQRRQTWVLFLDLPLHMFDLTLKMLHLTLKMLDLTLKMLDVSLKKMHPSNA